VIPPALPGWRTRSQRFDEAVVLAAEGIEQLLERPLDEVEFAVEPVPPSDPAPWETGAVPLARYFPADPAAGLAHRIVVYRHPLQARVADRAEEALLLREVLVEQVAHMLGRSPEDIDPGYTA